MLARARYGRFYAIIAGSVPSRIPPVVSLRVSRRVIWNANIGGLWWISSWEAGNRNRAADNGTNTARYLPSWFEPACKFRIWLVERRINMPDPRPGWFQTTYKSGFLGGDTGPPITFPVDIYTRHGVTVWSERVRRIVSDDCNTELSSISSFFFVFSRIQDIQLGWARMSNISTVLDTPSISPFRAVQFRISCFIFLFGNEHRIFQTGTETTAYQATMESRYLFHSLFFPRVCSVVRLFLGRQCIYLAFCWTSCQKFCLRLQRLRHFRTSWSILFFFLRSSRIFDSYKSSFSISFLFLFIHFPHDIGRLSRTGSVRYGSAGTISASCPYIPQRDGSLGFQPLVPRPIASGVRIIDLCVDVHNFSRISALY